MLATVLVRNTGIRTAHIGTLVAFVPHKRHNNDKIGFCCGFFTTREITPIDILHFRPTCEFDIYMRMSVPCRDQRVTICSYCNLGPGTRSFRKRAQDERKYGEYEGHSPRLAIVMANVQRGRAFRCSMCRTPARWQSSQTRATLETRGATHVKEHRHALLVQ